MKLFDLHCDTATVLYNTKGSISCSENQINLKKAQGFEKYIQTFAFYMHDDKSYESSWQYFLSAYDYFVSQLEKNNIQLIDIHEGVPNTSGIFAVLAIENAGNLIRNVEDLYKIKEKKINMLSITWNKKNPLAAGAEEDGGLSILGKSVVEEMNKCKMVLDVSHLNDQSFWDVMNCQVQFTVATHSNSKAICNHARNLTDEQFTRIVQKNGVVGINLYKDFLNKGCTGIENIYEHIEHFISLGGEKTISIGSDFDGCEPLSQVDSLEKVYKIADYLSKKNYSDELIYDIFFNNAYNYFTKLKLYNNM